MAGALRFGQGERGERAASTLNSGLRSSRPVSSIRTMD
jgi:hypothetical protein